MTDYKTLVDCSDQRYMLLSSPCEGYSDCAAPRGLLLACISPTRSPCLRRPGQHERALSIEIPFAEAEALVRLGELSEMTPLSLEAAHSNCCASAVPCPVCFAAETNECCAASISISRDNEL